MIHVKIHLLTGFISFIPILCEAAQNNNHPYLSAVICVYLRSIILDILFYAASLSPSAIILLGNG